MSDPVGPAARARGRTSAWTVAWTVPCAVAVVGFPATAFAVERENAIGVDVGGAMLVVANQSAPDLGPSVGLHYTYGLSDAFNLVADAGGSLVALKFLNTTTPSSGLTGVTHADAGLAYVLDVLQWVPWGAVEIGAYGVDGATGWKGIAGAALVVGLDYRLNRSWAIGVSGHEHMLLTDMAAYPSFVQLLARVEYVWGW